MIGTTVTQFLIEEQQRFPTATGDLTMVLRDIVTACKAIALAMRYGRLSEGDVLGTATGENVHGDSQKTLDILANDLFLQRTAYAGHVAGLVSEEMESPRLPDDDARGRYLLLYDPVDGSANLGEDAVIGTIFSILRRSDSASGHPTLEEFLQPGTSQVCAGYTIYGPSCMLVMTTGNGVNGFTLDPGLGEFILTHPRMSVTDGGSRLCVNMTHARRWEPSIRDYLESRVEEVGTSGSELDLRWSGCAVADVHRILVSGGIYLSPVRQPQPEDGTTGMLRLLYEVNPLAMIVEEAGGLAVSGSERVLERDPIHIHERVPVVLGSRDEVDRLVAHHLSYQEQREAGPDQRDN